MKTMIQLSAMTGLRGAISFGLLWAGTTGSAQTFSTIRSIGSPTNVNGRTAESQLVQGLDGTLYGTTVSADGNIQGTVFKVQPDGSGFAVLKWFPPGDGVNPSTGLALSGSTLYGTAYSGGSSNNGTVFKVSTDGTGFAVLKHFTGSDGSFPKTVLLSGGTLYGTTQNGGSLGLGTVFKVNTDGTGFTVVKDFVNSSDGSAPGDGLVISGSTLYGMTYGGGSSDKGTVFKVNTDGTGFTVLKHFSPVSGSDGDTPRAGLTLSGSTLYGATQIGGNGYGTVFSVNTNGTGFTVLKHFTGNDGALPRAPLTLSGSTLYGTTYQTGTSGDGTVFKLNTNGTGFTVLKRFTGDDGTHPYAGLVLSGSTLYGTTSEGGASGLGTVFQVKTDGSNFRVLNHFSGSDGVNPYAGLTLSGNFLYGTTREGGSMGNGTVFKIDLFNSLTIQSLGNAVVLTWANNGFSLQAAPSLTGGFTTIPGAVSPYTEAISGPQRFFRLIGN